MILNQGIKLKQIYKKGTESAIKMQNNLRKIMWKFCSVLKNEDLLNVVFAQS